MTQGGQEANMHFVSDGGQYDSSNAPTTSLQAYSINFGFQTRQTFRKRLARDVIFYLVQ